MLRAEEGSGKVQGSVLRAEEVPAVREGSGKVQGSVLRAGEVPAVDGGQAEQAGDEEQHADDEEVPVECRALTQTCIRSNTEGHPVDARNSVRVIRIGLHDMHMHIYERRSRRGSRRL